MQEIAIIGAGIGERQGPFELVVDAGEAGSVVSPLQARALPFWAIWGHVPWPVSVPETSELRQVYQGAARMAGILPIGRLPDDATPRAAVFWSMPVEALAAWPERNVAAWKAEVTALWPRWHRFWKGLRGPIR